MVRLPRRCQGHWVAERCGPTEVMWELGPCWKADVELVVVVMEGLEVSRRYA